MGGITAMNGVPCSTVWHAWVTEDNTVVLGSRNHGAVAAQRYAVEQCAGKILIQIGPLLSRVRRCYDAAVIANVHYARSRLREGDRSLIGVDGPIIVYPSPSDALIVGTIKSQVARHDVLRIGGIHGEHSEANAVVAAAAGPRKAIRRDLDPRRAAVH